jgi:hypothetical protein
MRVVLVALVVAVLEVIPQPQQVVRLHPLQVLYKVTLVEVVKTAQILGLAEEAAAQVRLALLLVVRVMEALVQHHHLVGPLLTMLEAEEVALFKAAMVATAALAEVVQVQYQVHLLEALVLNLLETEQLLLAVVAVEPLIPMVALLAMAALAL